MISIPNPQSPIPNIALTASTLEEERAVALSAGCDDFIRKPFREVEIFKAMNKYIGMGYIYAELASEPDSTQTEVLLITQEALAALPADWLASLHQATIEGDLEWMLTLIERIREQNNPRSNARRDLAKQFRFEELLALTQPRASETSLTPEFYSGAWKRKIHQLLNLRLKQCLANC